MPYTRDDLRKCGIPLQGTQRDIKQRSKSEKYLVGWDILNSTRNMFAQLGEELVCFHLGVLPHIHPYGEHSRDRLIDEFGPMLKSNTIGLDRPDIKPNPSAVSLASNPK